MQYTCVWYKASRRRSQLTPPKSPQNLHRTGKKDSWRTQTNLVCTRTQEKGAVTPQETDPDLPMSVQESLVEVWPAAGLGALSVWDLLKEVAIIFITSTIVWAQVKSRKGTKLHPSIENWIKDLLSMASPIRTRPSFPLSQSLPSGSFHEPLILIHQRATE